MVGFTIFAPQLLLALHGCPSKIAHWPAGCLATTSTQSVLVAPLSISRQNCLFFFFTSLCFHFTPPDKDIALSLSLITYLYGMHPMVLAHIYLVWVRCHPSKTSLPKEA